MKLEPLGQMLRDDIPPLPRFSVQGYPTTSCLPYGVRTCQLAANSVRLGSTEGSAGCTAEVLTQGHEQLVPRLDVYHREVVLPNMGSETSPVLEDTPGSGLGTKLLKMRHLPAGHLPESSYSSL